MMLALSPILIGLSIFLLMAVCILLILTILIQRPQGGGLSGAFGSGAGSGQTAFGTKTGDALTIFTIIMFVAFVLTSILLVFVTRPGQAPAGPATAKQAPISAPEAPAPAEGQPPAPQPGPSDAQPGATPPVTAPGSPPPAPADAAPASPPASPTTEPKTEPASEPKTGEAAPR